VKTEACLATLHKNHQAGRLKCAPEAVSFQLIAELRAES